MAKPETPGTTSAPGQQKPFTITNPNTGETKTVTQAEWREQKLGQQGWVKEEGAPPDEPTPPPV